MTQLPNLHQESTGQGHPLVVLHGLFGDSDNFRSIALHLERYFHVVRLDLPGHGQSETMAEYSFEAMADAVLNHLSTAGINEFHLLGHSLGGKVAMQMAGAATEMSINKLIVVDIAPRLYPPHHAVILDSLNQLRLDEINSRNDADKRLRLQIPDAGVRGFLLKSLHRHVDGNAGSNWQWRFDLAGLTASYEAIRLPPAFSQPVTASTLFVKGGVSDYLGEQDEPAIRTHFRDPHFKEIGGAGHWPHAEKPALFTRICLEFLNQINE